MDTLRYEYRPKTWIMALAGLFFAGCTAVLVQEARHNERGMVINGLITLETGGATIFLWGLAIVSVLFVAAGVYGVIQSLGATKEIVIDRHGITAPKGGFRSSIVTVPFATVTDLRIQRVQSQHFLVIHHREGKLTIPSSMLPSKSDFEKLEAIVAKRCGTV